MYIIDRFEENYAVIEYTDKYGEISFIKTAKNTLSSDVREGDAVYLENGIYYTDKAETEKRRKKIIEKLSNAKIVKKRSFEVLCTAPFCADSTKTPPMV